MFCGGCKILFRKRTNRKRIPVIGINNCMVILPVLFTSSHDWRGIKMTAHVLGIAKPEEQVIMFAG